MKERILPAKNTILQNRYHIIDLLGKGGMGTVYRAFDKKNNIFVAVKQTFADDNETRTAFKHEANLLENLTHNAFPRVFDFFSYDDELYLIMELIEGKDLGELLYERNKPFPLRLVFDWTFQILDALEYLHGKGVIHRDIKPSNLKLTSKGQIRILDLGIAKGAIGDMTTIQRTEGSMAAASKAYAPLEQVLKADVQALQMLSLNFSEKTEEILKQKTDCRTDIYALGATLYEFLTKKKPISSSIRALSVWSEKEDMCAVEMQNPSEYPLLTKLVFTAMEIEPTNRFQSAEQMKELLKSVSGLSWWDIIDESFPLLIEDFDASIALSPECANLYLERGKVYEWNGIVEKAIEDFTKAITLNSNNPIPYMQRGHIYWQNYLNEKAIDDLNVAIELNPNNAEAYHRLGIVFSHNDNKKAIENFNKAIELNPTIASCYYFRGGIYNSEKNYDQAIQDYNKAIELNQKNFQTYFSLDLTFDSKLIKLWSYESRGQTYYYKGDYIQAIRDFNQAIKMNPNHAIVYKYRSKAYERINEFEKQKADELEYQRLNNRDADLKVRDFFTINDL